MGSGTPSTTVKDLAIFETEHKLPKVPVKVTDIPADGDFSDTSGNVEWELDTQSSTGVAPGVKQVHLYFAQHLIDPDVEADFVKWIDDPTGPKQANASFGECETSPAERHAREHDPDPVQQQRGSERAVRHRRAGRTGAGRRADAAPGRARGPHPVRRHRRHRLLVPRARARPRAGAGNGVANQGVPIINYPAASPYVVAVGGTVLYPTARHRPAGARVPVAVHRAAARASSSPRRPISTASQHRPSLPVERQRNAQHRAGRLAAGFRTWPMSPATSPPAPTTSTATSSAAPPARAAPVSPRR